MKTQARVQGSTPLYAMCAYKHPTISSAIQEDLAHAVCVLTYFLSFGSVDDKTLLDVHFVTRVMPNLRK